MFFFLKFKTVFFLTFVWNFVFIVFIRFSEKIKKINMHSKAGHDKSNKQKNTKFYSGRAELQVCKERRVKWQPGKIRHFEEV